MVFYRIKNKTRSLGFQDGLPAVYFDVSRCISECLDNTGGIYVSLVQSLCIYERTHLVEWFSGTIPSAKT